MHSQLDAKLHLESKIANGLYGSRLMRDANDILASEGVRQMLVFLQEKYHLMVERVLMSNPKAPDYLVVLQGLLPIEDLQQKFAGIHGLAFTEYEAVWTNHYISLIGSGAAS